MGDTFGGEHHRPRPDGRGRSMRELQDRASFDNEPQVGCGALLIACLTLLLAAAAAIATALT